MSLNSLRVLWQYCLPQHLLSLAMGRLAYWRWRPFKNCFIRLFQRFYQVDLQEAEISDYREYPHFSAFFTRRLKSGARMVKRDSQSLLSPVDGTVSQLGSLSQTRLLQAKQHAYSMIDLLGGRSEWTERLCNGQYATFYLAPKDYHRVHMPVTGALRRMLYIPGKLFAVNPTATRGIERLFARNERVVCFFETQAGAFAMVFVGALIVGSIHTTWHGQVTPTKKRAIHCWDYPDTTTPAVILQQGDEVGFFTLGSTVIILSEPGKMAFNGAVKEGTVVQYGQRCGHLVQEGCEYAAQQVNE